MFVVVFVVASRNFRRCYGHYLCACSDKQLMYFQDSFMKSFHL